MKCVYNESMANNVGRPTKYKEEYNDLARKFSLLGSTDKDLARSFEVDEATINVWKVKYPEFQESIKKGKEFADANVADSLYNRARGFSHMKQVPMKIKQMVFDESGNGKLEDKIEMVVTEEYFPPDTAAAFIWLKNRQSDKWRDKPKEQIAEENKFAEQIKKALGSLHEDA